MKHHSMSSKAKERRQNVINRLENQLEAGTKTAKKMEIVKMDGSPSGIIATLPLTDADKTRINKELLTLKSRI